MFESNPKKTIKEVSSLPLTGDVKYIYRLTTTGAYYVWNELNFSYQQLAASSFLVGGTSINASDSTIADIYRSGRLGISGVADYTPKYAIEIYQLTTPSFFNSASENSESGYLITTKWDNTQLGNTTNKGWKLYGNPDTTSEKPNAFFITHWNGVAWLPSMQFHATTGSVTVGNVPTSYTPANYFEVWGDAKFSAKIEDAAGSYGTTGQVLSSNGTAGGVRWNSLITAWYTANTIDDAGGSKTSAIYRNGSIGINISPLATLHVQNTLAATASVNANAQVARFSRPSTSSIKWDNIAQFNLGSYSTAINATTRLDLQLNNADNTIMSDIMTWLANGNVGVGTTNPINNIDSAGSLGANIRSSSANTTTTTTDYTVVMTTTGTVVTLQTPSLTTTLRRIISVKNMAAGNITVTGNIDGTTQTLTLTTKESRVFHSNGVTWYII
jgi:hypothetical protein